MMKSPVIESVHIRGFRSLADVSISSLSNATVLIGSNGSGKSNFIRFFEMLSWMLRSRQLGTFVENQGGADDQLYGGNRETPRLDAEVAIRTSSGRNDYGFSLAWAHPDRFFFSEEKLRFSSAALPSIAPWQYLESGQRESAIIEAAQYGAPGVNSITARTIVHLLRNCAVYQFHDTSDTSNFKKWWDKTDNNQLRSHGGNLAAVLYRLEQEDIRRYEMICRHISRILPGFDRFAIEESRGKVLLRWQAKAFAKTFGAHLTSDGSLRFFALVTLLNLPPDMLPNVLLMDEPELGLHPAAVSLVGGMIRSLSTERQVIVATQSPMLVDAFNLEEIIVLDLENGRTRVREQLDKERFQVWLEEFTTGDLWRKNLLGGRP